MWKAAILGEKPTVSSLDRVPSPLLCQQINQMLYTDGDHASCFYDEVCQMAMTPLSIEEIIARSTIVYIIGMRGAIMGCVAILPYDADSEYLSTLCIDKNARSVGAGSRLLRHVQERHPRLVLHVYYPSRPTVTHDAKRIIAFYKRYGFMVTGCRGQYVVMSSAGWLHGGAQRGIKNVKP